MSYSNGVVTAPIDVEDIKSALGDGSNDVETLCVSSKVNEWSLTKPVTYGSPNYEPVGISGFGVVPVVAGKTDNFRFVYQPPTENFRMTDFNGYNHGTQKPQLSPASVDFVAVTPDSISGDNTAYLSMSNIRTLLTRIRSEQSGKHAIDQFVLRGEGDLTATINFGNYTGETLNSISTVTYSSTTIKLRNPGIKTRASYTGMFRSSYSGSASAAGAVYQFKDAPFTFDLKGYLQGANVINISTGQTFQGGCVQSCQVDDFHPVIGSSFTDLFADSDILLSWYALSSDRSAYVNIVFSSPLDQTLVTGLKNNLYMSNSTKTTYTCILGTGYINTAGDVVLKYNLNGDGTYAGSKCLVTYYPSYNGTDIVGLTSALMTWCKGKPLLRFNAPISNVENVPNASYPILICKIAK